MKNKILCISTGILTIFVFSNCAKPTNACFEYSPNSIDTSTVVFFNASCSENAFIFDWNFGDGTDTITEYLSVAHKFKNKGTYTIRLNAKREDGVTIRKETPVVEKVIVVQ